MTALCEEVGRTRYTRYSYYYRLYLPGPQHFFRNSNRAMATGWSFTRTLFPPLTRHPVYSATVCCAVFSPPSSHLILVQSSSAHPARTPHALRFAVVYTGCAGKGKRRTPTGTKKKAAPKKKKGATPVSMGSSCDHHASTTLLLLPR